MYYDYKSILNVDDIYLPHDHSSSLIKNSSLYSIKDPALLYKKNISSYLIMKKITLKKNNPHKYRLLKEKLLKRQEKEPFLDEKSFIKREENFQDTVVESQKPILKSSIRKIQKHEDYEENIVISEPDLRSKAFSIPILMPQVLKTDDNKVRSNSNKNKKNDFQKEKKKKHTINNNSNADPKSKTTKTSERQLPQNDAKKLQKKKKKPFRLKVPKHQRAMMQDFNDYYSHYSEEDKDDMISLTSQKNSSEHMDDESPNEKEFSQEKNTLEDLSKNLDFEGDQESENSLNTDEENNEEIDENAEENTKMLAVSDGIHLSLKKEVSFQPGNEKIDTPKLSPKKSRSMNRSRTVSKGNSSQESSEKKESTSRTRENTHFFPTQPNNPYIGLIEKLLESNDLFSEDIEGMMGIKQPDIILPEHLHSLGETERKIYEKIYKWNGQLETLLKKDEKEIRKYQKKLDNMFISQKNSEEKEESGSEEFEEGEDN